MWFPGNEQRYNRFLNNRMVHALAIPYTRFAKREMIAKYGPVGVREARYHDIGTLFLNVHPVMPKYVQTGMSERKTKIQVEGG